MIRSLDVHYEREIVHLLSRGRDWNFAKRSPMKASMRLRSDIFVSALIRQAELSGASAMLRRRGGAEAGAIFVKIDRLDGRAALYGPAPQSEELPIGVARLFTRHHAAEWLDPGEIEAKLRREIEFDPDVWIVEIEDRQGRNFIDLAK